MTENTRFAWFRSLGPKGRRAFAGSWGLGGAMVLGALAYGLAVLVLLGLPETRGRELT